MRWRDVRETRKEEGGWICGLRCPRSPRGQKLWKWLCRSEKVRRRRARNKQYEGTGNSEGRELSVTYWTNKLVCRQNGLRGWAGQKNNGDWCSMWTHPFWSGVNLDASSGSVSCIFPVCVCDCLCVYVCVQANALQVNICLLCHVPRHPIRSNRP